MTKKKLNLKPDYRPLDMTLLKRNKTRKQLKDDLKLSPTLMAKFSASDFVSLTTIAYICDYLDCSIEEVVKFVPNEDADE
ncbi:MULTISPECIES: helix-turn-helix domain-containing protein [Bacillus]|uniref:helix-turn-helix domain-containing protein n=1 Tax=Bacillus TaxID=1386 RepID=UPI0013EE889F|nr:MULTISPECIES: helix-turn-helix transcriptional regulator [Bacillus]KAF6546248.1 helix-turn-helix domain-containing protein [Bacillus sp. EKM207B]KAF6547341.1 helix-turn-helix domain-containing protein [Bacillus sp. EKM206B]MBL3613527.1 helix-turn-helix domain-containing protein [Bacillus sp. RHFS18]